MVKKIFISGMLYLASAVMFSVAAGTLYYVSPTGNDANNGTSISTPVKTINKAISYAISNNGDIIYVMTGTYNTTLWVTKNGLTISAYPGNTPVIDGGTTLPGENFNSMLSVVGNNNTVNGFEVKNSNVNGTQATAGIGVYVTGVHNTLSNLIVHDSWQNGIIIHGDYTTVEYCTVYNNVLNNSGTPVPGAASGLSAGRNNSAAALIPGIVSYAILRHNITYNNWGEGISCYEADHCTMEDNITYDNWAPNLYLSDATNSLVQRNLVYISSAPAIPTRDNAITGLSLMDEVSTVPRSANNTLINNLIYKANLQAFSGSLVANSGLNNVLIANNTIIDGPLITGFGGTMNITNTNSQIRNNIILGSGCSVPNATGITFSNNNWSVTPLAATSTSDVIGNPQIARTGSTAPGQLTANYFMLTSCFSPVINKALVLSQVTGDYFGTSRGNLPDIGGQEYNLPDVIVTSLIYNPSTHIFSCVVKNQGTRETPSGTAVGVKYSVDGVSRTWGNVATPPLAAGASATVESDGGTYIIPDGIHTITAFVDDVDRFPESNETNNQLSQSITVGNLLLNPSFDSNTSPWIFNLFSPAVATVASIAQTGYTGKAAKTTITNAGTADWHIQLVQVLPITTGNTYMVTFKASAAAARTIKIEFQQAISPYTNYWASSAINITTTPTTYGPYTFVCTTTDATEKFCFFLGNSTAAVWIDDVVITAYPIPLKSPKIATNLTNENLAANLSIYPNPAMDNLTIQLSNLSVNEKAQIYNTMGKLVKEFNVSSLSQQFNIEDLSNGLYFVKMKSNPKMTQKFIKQ
ncbi:MAG: carbohydrate binding domain-containing protein [Sulfuricurvum sp.]|nr:carbohydrate binding domain-containing protein [Sulfuricurvum sp.]